MNNTFLWAIIFNTLVSMIVAAKWVGETHWLSYQIDKTPFVGAVLGFRLMLNIRTFYGFKTYTILYLPYGMNRKKKMDEDWERYQKIHRSRGCYVTENSIACSTECFNKKSRYKLSFKFF